MLVAAFVARRLTVAGFAIAGLLLVAPMGASAAKFVVEDWNGAEGDWQTNPALDFKGWYAFDTDPKALLLSEAGIAGHGLYAYPAFFPVFLPPAGATAQWRYVPPGTATVYKAEYAPAKLILGGCLTEGFRLKDGSWEPTVNAPPGEPLSPSHHPPRCGSGGLPGRGHGQRAARAHRSRVARASRKAPATGVHHPAPAVGEVFCAEVPDPCALAGSPIENSAVFGIELHRHVTSPFELYLAGMTLYETDYVDPYFTGATNSLQGWVRAGAGTVVPSATDTGLGVKTIRLTQPNLSGTQTEQAQSSPCTGDRNHRCPATWNAAEPVYAPSFPYNVDGLPEGVDRFGLKAISIVEHESDPQGSMDETTVPPTKVDRQPPTGLTASGDLSQPGLYIDGQGTRSIALSATDNLSGIRRLSLEDEGHGLLASYTPPQCVLVPLADNQCPLAISQELAADTSGMPEGANHLRVVAEDLAGNVAYGGSWTVYVDRTAPVIPELFEAGALESRKTATTALSWSTAADPALADGSQGSGLAYYSYRYSVGGDGFTAWAGAGSPEADVTGLSVGQSVTIEVLAIDKVGNRSLARSATVSVEAEEGEESCLDPAADSPAKLKECGDDEYTRSSRTAMPNGGTETHFKMGAGTVVTFVTPPESFDAATANSAELEEYGIPTAPPTESPEYTMWKQMIDNLPYEPPPEAMAKTTLSNAPATEPSGNWSGYLDQANFQRYNQATAYFYPPKSVEQGCPEATMSMWAGLGGFFSKHLSQDGFNVEAGTRNYPAWWEVLEEKETLIKEKSGKAFVATKGAYFLAETKLIGTHDRHFYMYDYATHKHKSFYVPGISENDRSTADYIAAERLTIEENHVEYLTPLLQFGELEAEGYTELHRTSAAGQVP